MEYRQFPDARGDEFRAIATYAFSPDSGPYDPDEADDRPIVERRRGLFDGDDPKAICAHYDFDLRIRGADRHVAGLSAVACPPENRRQGLVTRLLRESLAEYRTDGITVSALWPFEFEFYRRYGWKTASQYTHLKTPPEQLAFADDSAAGSFRPLDGDDYEAALPVLEAMAERYDLTVRWTEEWWRERTLRGWERDPYVYGWERDGELRGLVRYTIDSEDDTVMTVGDVAFVDETAWLNLLRFCRNHDSQVDEVRIRAPPDVDVLDRVDDPRATSHETRVGPMVRLVDVAEALEQLDPGLPLGIERPDGTDRLLLDVSDPLVDWNDRRFDLRLSPDGMTVEPVAESKDEHSIGQIDDHSVVTTDVGTLSQLYVGYQSAREAERNGTLSASESGIAALDALFPPRTTYLREGF